MTAQAVPVGTQPVAAETGPPAGADRFSWTVAIGALLLIVIGVGGAVVAGRGQQPIDASTPVGVTLTIELAIRRGEADRAWDLLTASAKAATTRQEFLARAAAYQPGKDARFSVEDVRNSGDTAYLNLVWTQPTSGFFGLGAGARTLRNPVTLQRKEGSGSSVSQLSHISS